MTTEDTLLNGRVRLRQPERGLRAGHDAVLLAASIPAKPGQAVLEAGCGTGAVFLCLLARIPGLRVTAIERDPGLAALARENAALNGWADQVTVLEADITDPALRPTLPPIAHAFANPPYWPAGTRPPESIRANATHAEDTPLTAWTSLLAHRLARLGSLTLILPAARLADGIAALTTAHCGSHTLLPLWPRPGQAAKRILLAARHHGRSPARVLPGLALHDGDGTAEAVLREGAGLGM
ncbi:tRNA1(Val) (adenine(37)-N6)-methyltransferase [Falsiroseomonas stagni]|uniref:tRNA1(Val) A37 N6-methylase TrmN6 n=1 Tax=Falsiroseomonas stagni DSM 19981 TaxID=1123062 RepID=A0A1I4BAY7_9PROT|nr:methyltransferase domain-containing protein [Falsiroseomonas stagni]SFK65703.1 tRNA1(Val) A37 N6-methylase TrmN6 [Falsiroseomonas stagni DSM 19981]